jgi:signal transduction histidine kinase
MSEVSRLSALVASHMKVDFVASISHELRSPLHGILASVEFLQDEDLSGMQAEMVTTIVCWPRA